MESLLRRQSQVLVLALIVLVPCVLLIALTVRSAMDLRIRQAAKRHLDLARLSARLMDDQVRTDAALLRSKADQYGLGDQIMSGNRGGMRRSLQAIVGSAPSLIAVSLHQVDGQALAVYPSPIEGPASWMLGRAPSGASVRAEIVAFPRGSESLAVAIPLRRASRPWGYLAGYCKIDANANWLPRPDQEEGISAAIVSARGIGLDAAPGPNADRPVIPVKFDARPLGQRPEGSLYLPRHGGIGDNVVVFARTTAPNLAVMITQPVSGILTSSLIQATPLIGCLAACSALLILAASRFPALYRGQETMREQLLEQNRHLKLLDQAKSEFLANVSHDLWTPMASLEISLTGLLDPTIHWRPEQIRESLQLANHELTQLINRVRNLLEMARLDANENTGQKEPCDLVDSVGSALERLAPLLKDRQVYADFPAYPLMFLGHHAQFEIVIMNLLDNALKYSPPGSPLTIKGDRRGTDLYLSVRDCGPGVAPAETELIFQKFYRGQKMHAKGGTGLGLAICKAVVENHGGVIGILSPPGGGAEFWLSVPGMPRERLE